MFRKWKILCLVLFFGNLFAFRWLIDTKLDEVSEMESRLAAYKFDQAMRDAEANFQIGRLRVYRFELLDEPPLPHVVLTNKFTGQMDGPFELWLWRCYTSEKRFEIRLQEHYVDTYNQRMERLHRLNPLVQNTNEPPVIGNVGYAEMPSPGVLMSEKPPDPKQVSKRFFYQLRLPKTSKLDPLTRFNLVTESNVYCDWPSSVRKSTKGKFLVFSGSFWFEPNGGLQALIIEPGYHPAHVFQLAIPPISKEMNWTGWQEPNYLVSTNNITSLRENLTAENRSTNIAPDSFQLRYRILEMESDAHRTWMKILTIAGGCLAFVLACVGLGFFLNYMNKEPSFRSKEKSVVP